MTPVIVVPYHQDELLPAGSLPVPGDGHRTVSPPLPDGDVWHRLTSLYDAVADEVAAAEAPPVVVSGDCLVSVGVLAGTQRAGADPSVIWFDAHGDVHTLETSTSGYLGGLSLRLLLGAHADRIARLGLRPVAEDRVTLVGARDLDPAEVEYLATAAIQRRSVTDAVVPDGPVVLHIDLDVIDADDLPGLLFPVSDGPSASAVVDAVRRIVDTGQVVALDIACPWHPADDPRRAALLAALIG
jgi:arginase